MEYQSKDHNEHQSKDCNMRHNKDYNEHHNKDRKMRHSKWKKTCESFLDEAMEYNDLPGLVIGVLRGGESWTGARGVRDVRTGDLLREDDIFHCASVSKLFTSAAIMKLVEAGELHLDDRLCDILPEMFPYEEGERIGNAHTETCTPDSQPCTPDSQPCTPDSQPCTPDSQPCTPSIQPRASVASYQFSDPRAHDIRLWQMLTHTAGIGDVKDYRWEECLTGETALADYVHSEEVTGQPLLWAPGTGGFRYSNIAYEILGHIVSVKSGMPYETFIRKHLLDPAGMTDSTMLTCQRFRANPGESLTGSPVNLPSGAPVNTPADTPEVAQTAVAVNTPAATPEVAQTAVAVNTPAAKPEAAAAGAPEAAPAAAFPGAPGRLLTDEIRRRNAAAAAGWHPMALPHEKAADRSIVPVKFYPYTRSHAPSSTLTSNAEDLLRWAAAHMKGSGADPHIWHEYAEVPNNREKMGLGWFMRKQGGYSLYGHEGTDDGFRASLWICPELELGIVVLSNLSGAPVKKLNKKLFERILQEGI